VYDSTTRQHKNYTIDEAKAARERLYEAIARNEHLATATPKISPDAGTEPDRQTLAALVDLMADSGSIDFLREHRFGGSFWWSRLDGIKKALYRSGPEHEFIDQELEQLRTGFQTACSAFMNYVVTNTFVLNSSVSDAVHGIPPEWHFEERGRFDRAVKELDTAAKNLCSAYDKLVRVARKKLAPDHGVHPPPAILISCPLRSKDPGRNGSGS
jgi:hypothetical protein